MEEGIDVKFICRAKSNNVCWYKDDESLPSHVEVQDRIIVIRSPTLLDRGIYECTGSYQDIAMTFQAFASLTVISKLNTNMATKKASIF